MKNKLTKDDLELILIDENDNYLEFKVMSSIEPGVRYGYINYVEINGQRAAYFTESVFSPIFCDLSENLCLSLVGDFLLERTLFGEKHEN